jgi:histidinol-phosphatase (PHP family)
MIDYHLHTVRCGHANGTARDYVNQAKTLDLSEIGFAEHLPLFHTIDATLAMSWDELPSYIAEIQKLKEEGGVPEIKLGIEADYIPKFANQTREALEQYDFDYVLGSVHSIDGWGFDDPRYLDGYDAYFDLYVLYERYFDLLVEAAQSGLFDVLAHPDLIKKYRQLEAEPVAIYEKVVPSLAKTGVAIEVSSAGLRKPCREIYPGPKFLDLCARHGVPVTLGSDAHEPGQVGCQFDELHEALATAGITQIAAFSGRERKLVDLK